MATLFYYSNMQLIDGSGNPYAGAKLNFYEAGTSTPLDTFSDNALSSANANPVVADANGRFGSIYLAVDDYKVVATDADDNTIWTQDNVINNSLIGTELSNGSVRFGSPTNDGTTDGHIAAQRVYADDVYLKNAGFLRGENNAGSTFLAIATIGTGDDTIFRSLNGKEWQFQESSGPTTVMRLDADTATPQLTVTGTGSNGFVSTQSTASVNTVLSSESGGGLAGTATNHNFRFQSNAIVRGRFDSDGGFVVGSPTGGSKGAGTINATAVYDDNVLLTCYVLEAANGVEIDIQKWQDKAKGTATTYEVVEAEKDGKIIREHVAKQVEKQVDHIGVKRFKARLGTEYDPLDIDKYARHWKDKGHLTSMPNEEKFSADNNLAVGEWMQRLIETVEIQAVHIDKLNQRIKALEEA